MLMLFVLNSWNYNNFSHWNSKKFKIENKFKAFWLMDNFSLGKKIEVLCCCQNCLYVKCNW